MLAIHQSCMVPTLGIEPRCAVFQAAAVTTLATTACSTYALWGSRTPEVATQATSASVHTLAGGEGVEPSSL